MVHRRTLLAALGTAALKHAATPAFACALDAEDTEGIDLFDGAAPDTPFEADVLVVGAGGAGLAAAISAREAGADVLVLEAAARPGGNTALSAGFMNAAADPGEVEDFVRDTLWSGESRSNPTLVRTLAEGAQKTLEWLADAGVEFLPKALQPYGAVAPRSRRTAVGNGSGYVEPLYRRARALGVRFALETRAVRVLPRTARDGARALVVVESRTGDRRDVLVRRALVAATGGYSGNTRICALYEPRLADLKPTGCARLDGHFMEALRTIGAETVGFDFIGLGTASMVTGRYVPGTSGIDRLIFVDKRGERFYPEDGLCDLFAEAVLQRPGRAVFALFDAVAVRAMRPAERVGIERALEEGDAFRAATLSDLGNAAGLPVEALERTVRRFNRAVDEKKDPFGRHPRLLEHRIAKPPFHLVRLTIGVQLTLGGLRIDKRARVLDRDGHPMGGFYAAGETTGGVHGTNRLEGNALAAAFVFGRIAGREAAALPILTGPPETPPGV